MTGRLSGAARSGFRLRACKRFFLNETDIAVAKKRLVQHRNEPQSDEVLPSHQIESIDTRCPGVKNEQGQMRAGESARDTGKMWA